MLEKRKKLREEVLEKARRWANTLPFKATVILVGSYARGDFNLWSDVDLIVISDGLRGKPLSRLKVLDVQRGFQVIPLTSSEFERLVRKRDLLAIEALERGIILRDDLKVVRKQPQLKNFLKSLDRLLTSSQPPSPS